MEKAMSVFSMIAATGGAIMLFAIQAAGIAALCSQLIARKHGNTPTIIAIAFCWAATAYFMMHGGNMGPDEVFRYSK